MLLAVNEDLVLLKRLESLRNKHRELDEKLNDLAHGMMQDQLSLMRLKKEKLALRDEISRIEQILYPDLIA